MPEQTTSQKTPPAAACFDEKPDSAYVRRPVVESLFDVSGTTVDRWVRAGIIPKPYKLGARVKAWNVGELRAAMRRDAA